MSAETSEARELLTTLLRVTCIDPLGLLFEVITRAPIALDNSVVACPSLCDARRRCNYTCVYAAGCAPMPARQDLQLTEINAACPWGANMEHLETSGLLGVLIRLLKNRCPPVKLLAQGVSLWVSGSMRR